MEFVVNGALDLAAIEAATDAEFAGAIKWTLNQYGAEASGIRVSSYGIAAGYWIEFTCGGVYHSHTSFTVNGRRINDNKSFALNALESYVDFIRAQQNVRSS